MLSRIPGRAAIMGSSPIRMLERIPVDLAPYTIFDFYPQLPEGNDYSGEIEIENYIFCKFYNPQPNVDDSQNGMNCIVNTIAYGAFANCVNLTGVKLPTHLTEIRPAAFAKCASLKKIDGSECRNVRIYPYAFDGCTSLTSADLTFVSRVSYYGGKSFDNCPNLQHVILKAEEEEVRMLDRRSTPSLILKPYALLPKNPINMRESYIGTTPSSRRNIRTQYSLCPTEARRNTRPHFHGRISPTS